MELVLSSVCILWAGSFFEYKFLNGEIINGKQLIQWLLQQILILSGILENVCKKAGVKCTAFVLIVGSATEGSQAGIPAGPEGMLEIGGCGCGLTP